MGLGVGVGPPPMPCVDSRLAIRWLVRRVALARAWLAILPTPRVDPWPQAREQMEREIADGTMDAAEGARALTLLALPAAAAEAAGEDEVGEEVCAS